MRVRRRIPLSLQTNLAVARPNNCIRNCSSREVLGRTRRKCDSGSREERKERKNRTSKRKSSTPGKGKKDITRRSKILGFLHGKARGNLRYAVNVSLLGSAHSYSYRISNELPSDRSRIQRFASVSSWRLVIEICCLGSHANRKSCK